MCLDKLNFAEITQEQKKTETQKAIAKQQKIAKKVNSGQLSRADACKLYEKLHTGEEGKIE